MKDFHNYTLSFDEKKKILNYIYEFAKGTEIIKLTAPILHTSFFIISFLLSFFALCYIIQISSN